jgi:hypothetical protein
MAEGEEDRLAERAALERVMRAGRYSGCVGDRRVPTPRFTLLAALWSALPN